MGAVTHVVTKFNEGRMPAVLVTASFTANADIATVDVWNLGVSKVLKAYTFRLTQSGTGTTVDFDVDGSFDGTNWTATSINNLTASASEYHPATGAIDHDSLIGYRYLRINCIAVGTANTHVGELWLY